MPRTYEENPFTPTFGITPPLLVGRDAEIAAVRRSLTRGPGDPARAVLLTGARGTGKTVLLNALEDAASQQGWAVISETVQPGLVEVLTRTTLPMLRAALDPRATDSTLTSASATVFGIGGALTRQVSERHPAEPSLRDGLESLARIQADRGSGVFISLDEVHRHEIAQITPLFHAIQHCFRQGLPVAFVAAGLPSTVSRLLSDSVVTYLRRAERFALGTLPDALVRAALREPILRAGRSISPDALDRAADAVHGYPFLIQVVGFELWEVDPGTAHIGADAVDVALVRAVKTANRLVHEPALADLSDADRRFLAAMARIPGEPVRLADILERLGATRDHVNKYRARLIAAEIIEPAGRGLIRFAIPFLSEYLRSLGTEAAGSEDG
ncbi:MAG: ATP-binding protein [Bifidobacteriaceae bacterium]|jgi:type II secretory pathway predicted ATPase ExeA|nr:ATP-binding protein [Bifidobacteriaceae bacterium]